MAIPSALELLFLRGVGRLERLKEMLLSVAQTNMRGEKREIFE